MPKVLENYIPSSSYREEQIRDNLKDAFFDYDLGCHPAKQIVYDETDDSTMKKRLKPFIIHVQSFLTKNLKTREEYYATWNDNPATYSFYILEGNLKDEEE